MCIASKNIKEKNYDYTSIRAYCEECGEEMSIPGLIDKDQQLFDAHYRLIEDIVTKAEINRILEKYNIGKAPLSLVLGFGELAYNKAMISISEENSDLVSDSKIEEVTQYILCKNEEITPLSLQKQLYFIQGIYLSLYKQILFNVNCEAWLHGPVYPEIYHKYKKYGYDPIEDKENLFCEKDLESKLPFNEKKVIDLVTQTFGRYSGKILETITHKEEPWKIARRGINTIDYSNEIITIKSIEEYFADVAIRYNLLDSADIIRYIDDILIKDETDVK